MMEEFNEYFNRQIKLWGEETQNLYKIKSSNYWKWWFRLYIRNCPWSFWYW